MSTSHRRRADTPQRAAWHRLRRVLTPRRKPSQYIVGGLCLALGVSFAAQVSSSDDDLEGLSQQELVRLLDESDRQADSLQSESRDLDRSLDQLHAGQKDSEAARAATEERRETLQILAGTVPAEGQGVQISISDPGGSVQATSLLGVVQELRNAGAEVIQIDDVRVVASTSITAAEDGSLLVDGTAISAPYEIRAIGDPAVMQPALKIPGGAADTVEADDAAFSVRAVDSLTIDAVRDLPRPQYAEVVK